MSAVTFGEADDKAGLPFTVEELDRLPHDGRRYELLDGVLVVSPRPTTVHQFTAFQLGKILDEACPEELCVMLEPALQLTATTTEFSPDIVVVPVDDVGEAKLTKPPLLVVEIRSPSTAIIDLNRKKTAYQRFGVPSYWIVDPDPARPEVTVFELREGRYVTVAVTTAPLTVERPFSITINPARLTSRLRPARRQADG
jgi:Uma2 family endonuclease